MAKPTRIVVFAKAPYPGFAKTRLIPALGLDGSAAFASRLLDIALDACLASNANTVELSAVPDIQDSRWQGFEIDESIAVSSQGSGDLGERLYRALSRVIDSGEQVLVIGADCPSLSASILNEAIGALQNADAVIIPAKDGGYVLLGLTRCDPSLFSDVPWSTAAVADITFARLRELGYRVARLPELQDIDEPQDLDSLPEGWLRAKAM